MRRIAVRFSSTRAFVLVIEGEGHMSSHLVFRDRTLSRRRFISGVAVATAAAASTVALVSTAACAQAPEWREYRDEGIGFRIETPVELSFERNTLSDGETVRSTTGQGEFDQMRLFVLAFELRVPLSVNDGYQFLREGPYWAFPPIRVEQCTVSGVPAWDFIRDADDVNYIHRGVVVDNRLIMVLAMGNGSHANPIARRFLGSLAL
jgi:hypothetical protein